MREEKRVPTLKSERNEFTNLPFPLAVVVLDKIYIPYLSLKFSLIMVLDSNIMIIILIM